MKGKLGFLLAAATILVGSIAYAETFGEVTVRTRLSVGTGSVPGTNGLHMTGTGSSGTNSTPIVGTADHLYINTTLDNKNVRINSRTYTQTSGDTIGFQSAPSQGASTTGEVFGAQIKPRVAGGFDAATVNGMGLDSELKSGAGDLSSDLRGINMYLGATGSGTIGGDIVGIRARVESAINPTGNIILIKLVDGEGAQDWDGLVKFGAALGTQGGTTNSDKTANSKVGTIKVLASDGTVYHIQLYADS